MKYTIRKWNQTFIVTDKTFRISLAKWLFLLLLVLSSHTSVFAGDAILTWDPNTESNLAGYRVYLGTAPGTYGSPVDVGNQTTHTVTGLGIGTFYFAVAARDTSGNESALSNEVSKTFSGDTTAPVFSAIAASNITSTGASITWNTNEASDTQVQYGTTTSYGSSTGLNSSLVTSHSRNLTGLLPSTTYHYRVISRDAAGNVATSGNNTFTTSVPPDTTAPAISGIASGSVTSNGATITWTTNEASNTQIEYGTTTAYGSSTSRIATMVTLHSQALTGLVASTTYHFRVLSIDAAGNIATSGDNTFATVPLPDTTAPTISGVTASNLTTTGAIVTWSTNEAANSQVEYGTTPSYGSVSTLNATLVTSHSRSLTGLSPATTYHYRVISKDGAGNTRLSANNTFVTTAAPDTAPPVISNIAAINVSSTSAVITWTTNEASTSEVEYGTGVPYDFTSTSQSPLVTNHSRSLTGLGSSTTYHFKIRSRDAAGNVSASSDQTFMTLLSADKTGPVISNIAAGTLIRDGIVITWNTNEPATTEIEYGTTIAYGNSIPLNATLLTDHTATLSGLSEDVLYHYRVKSADALGNLTVSADHFFTAQIVPDALAPADVILFAAKSDNKTVQLSWTNPSDPDFAGVVIRYRIDGTYPTTETDGFPVGDFKGLPNEGISTDHTGLKNKVTYYYAAFTYDVYGNYSRTAKTFATPDEIQGEGSASSSSPAGGCGMIIPKGGTSGPQQAAEVMTFIGIIVIALFKKLAGRIRAGA